MNRTAVKRIGQAGIVAFLFLAVSGSYAGAAGSAFTYQGQLADSNGAVNGLYDFEFRLMNADVGGSQLGATLSRPGVAVWEGRFTTALDFGAAALVGEQRWLQVGVRPSTPPGEAFVTLTPRQEIMATPYAGFALNAPFRVNGSAVYYSGGRLGLGVTSPVTQLDVRATSGSAIQAITNATSGNTVGVFGQSDSTSGVGMSGRAAAATGSTTGGYFQSYSNAGRGVYGYASATSGVTWGVYGQNASDEGAAVCGRNDRLDGLTKGVSGYVDSVDGSAVYGSNNANGNSGALGSSAGAMGLSIEGGGIGVMGRAFGGGGVGVYGAGSLFSGEGTAGRFFGDVQVTGTLSKGGGSFKIDHPLDPANKYLCHSFVESPDMMNVYNGNTTTDEAGFATIEMPAWFEALNRDFRYQLTPIGQFAQAIVAEELRDNRFVIQTDKPGVRVSWQITGIRHDRWADAHRIPVELEKAGEERGKYLHPSLFGAAEEEGIDAGRALRTVGTQPVAGAAR